MLDLLTARPGRVTLAIMLSVATAGTAGAATRHTMSVSQTTGSGGATTFLQNSASSSALQGEVASSARTSIHIPFAVLGEYDASGSTFGIGVAGVSSTGYAVAAEAFGGSPSMLALSGGNNDALDVYGSMLLQTSDTAGLTISTTQNSGVVANTQDSGDTIDAYSNSSNNLWNALYATSNAGAAVNAESLGGPGVKASSMNGNGSESYATSGVGVYGYNSGTTSPNQGDDLAEYSGTYGRSTEGVGAIGVNIQNTGTPVRYGDSTYFYDVANHAGVVGVAFDGLGSYSYSQNDLGALVENNNQYPTLYINSNDASDTSSYLIDAAAGDLTTDTSLFHVDRTGAVYAKGGFTTMAASSRSQGADGVAMYAPQQSVATVEDFGSARLTDGVASVPLASDFGQTMDASQPYMVFLTPYGDTRGLYVASQTATGFVVREQQGGHTNANFSYRIVARPFGKSLARMPKIHATGFAKARQLQTARSAARNPVSALGAKFDAVLANSKHNDARRAAIRAAALKKASLPVPQIATRPTH